jgi:hypothetical protein
MSTIVQIGKRQLTAESICQHLTTSPLLPQLLREIIIDDLLSEWERSPAAILPTEAELVEYFNALSQSPAYQGMNQVQLSSLAARTLNLQSYKQQGWGHKINSYFLQRKSTLDRYVYSVMQVADGQTAQELFFRIQAGEKTFSELAFKHSEGEEAKDGGKIGPASLINVDPTIAQQLLLLKPGQLSPLFILNQSYLFLRLEAIYSTPLDPQLSQFLLDEMFESWIQQLVAKEIGLAAVTETAIAPDLNPLPALPPAEIEPEEKFTLERGDTDLLINALGNLDSLAPQSQEIVVEESHPQPPTQKLGTISQAPPLEPEELIVPKTFFPNSNKVAPTTQIKPAVVTEPFIKPLDRSYRIKSHRPKMGILIAIGILAIAIGGFFLLREDISSPQPTPSNESN